MKAGIIVRAPRPALRPHRHRGRVSRLDHPRRTTAHMAAGVIHSSIERGFIRAAVVPIDDLVVAGPPAAHRGRRTLRLEGKECKVQDGHVINLRFAA